MLTLGAGIAGSACASDTGLIDTDASNPTDLTSTDFTAATFTAADFTGEFSVEQVFSQGTQQPLDWQPTVAVDPIAASFELDTGCNRHIGSYSIFEDGRFSVTLAGGTSRTCVGAVQAQDELLTTLTGNLEMWQDQGEGRLELSTATGEAITLTR